MLIFEVFMNILAVNGSPKGENSVTLQTIYYLEKLFPDHNFEVLHAGQRIDYRGTSDQKISAVRPHYLCGCDA